MVTSISLRYGQHQEGANLFTSLAGGHKVLSPIPQPYIPTVIQQDGILCFEFLCEEVLGIGKGGTFSP